MLPVEIIKKKRDGFELTKDEIRSFILDYLNNKITDYQMSAFLMAVFFRGMSESETLALTEAMLYSGEVIKFYDNDNF
jgi:pyrimidine-nucleoside phosphorylase